MKVIVQRSKNSYLVCEKVESIEYGLVLLVGFRKNDTLDDILYLVRKIVNLRIFDDVSGIMNKSILDVKGSILSISQFTLYANTKKGNRPSYDEVMKADEALVMYNKFNEELSKFVDVKTGIFQSEMLVNICNDGPVTIILESEK